MGFSDTYIAHPSGSKGFDLDTNLIYDDWACEETIVSYCDETETDVFASTTGNFNNITADQTKKMNDNAINGNIGHLDNVIDTDGLESLKGTEVDKFKPQMEYCVCLPKVTV